MILLSFLFFRELNISLFMMNNLAKTVDSDLLNKQN